MTAFASITKPASLVPGNRTIDAEALISIVDQLNGILAGTTQLDCNQTATTTITAAGTNRATSTTLTTGINNVTTAAASTGVTLPAATVGARVTIFNNGANPIKVYGAGSDTIDGVAGSTGVTLTNALRAIYICVGSATWISAQLGVVSA